MTFSATSRPLINADVLSLRRLADVALFRAAPRGLELCASGTFAQDLNLETVADDMVRRHAQCGEHLAGIRRVRHEPAAIDMRQILTDQPPGGVPSAVCALPGDALDTPLLADVVVTERNEPARRRHFDTVEPTAAARARFGAAAARGLRPRTRRRALSSALRFAEVTFRRLSFPCTCRAARALWG